MISPIIIVIIINITHIVIYLTVWEQYNYDSLPLDYTECPRRNVPDFGRVFLMLENTDITQNTYIQS
jgi:hypothetical protein